MWIKWIKSMQPDIIRFFGLLLYGVPINYIICYNKTISWYMWIVHILAIVCGVYIYYIGYKLELKRYKDKDNI